MDHDDGAVPTVVATTSSGGARHDAPRRVAPSLGGGPRASRGQHGAEHAVGKDSRLPVPCAEAPVGGCRAGWSAPSGAPRHPAAYPPTCLLYTSDAADDLLCVDL